MSILVLYNILYDDRYEYLVGINCYRMDDSQVGEALFSRTYIGKMSKQHLRFSGIQKSLCQRTP